jgi:hypothetical protein
MEIGSDGKFFLHELLLFFSELVKCADSIGDHNFSRPVLPNNLTVWPCVADGKDCMAMYNDSLTFFENTL